MPLRALEGSGDEGTDASSVGPLDSLDDGKELSSNNDISLGSFDAFGTSEGQYACVGLFDADGLRLDLADGIKLKASNGFDEGWCDGTELAEGILDGFKEGLDDGFNDGVLDGASLDISVIRPWPVTDNPLSLMASNKLSLASALFKFFNSLSFISFSKSALSLVILIPT